MNRASITSDLFEELNGFEKQQEAGQGRNQETYRQHLFGFTFLNKTTC